MGQLDHLWLHFTEMGRYDAGEELQVIVRSDGCYIEDLVHNHDNLELAL